VDDVANNNDDIMEDVAIGEDDDNDVPDRPALQEEAIEGEVTPPLDEYHEVQRQVLEALDRGDTLHMESGNKFNLHENR